MKLYIKHRRLLTCFALSFGLLIIFEIVYKLIKYDHISILQKLGINYTVFNYRMERYQLYQEALTHRYGPGENGEKVQLTYSERVNLKISLLKDGYNKLVSNRISLQRSLPDIRNYRCREIKYPKYLPTATVIILFHNEAWSTLLRTVHSVINRSPPRYLREIILVDDFSSQNELKLNLLDYIQSQWTDKIVRLVRNQIRLGVAKGRIKAAKLAVGDVIIFLDSHCEVTIGWLEPILFRINQNHEVLVMPINDQIDIQTFAFYGKSKVHEFGSFWWDMRFGWDNIPEHFKRNIKSQTEPFKTATMPNGIFAVDRNYFFHIGSYDDEMILIGGENLEISFRVWMCGGSLEILPCSHVGHISRENTSEDKKNIKYYYGMNAKRIADVWLDDYKKIFYKYRPELKNKLIPSVTNRIILREKLLCNSFEWYLKNVVTNKFIPDRNHSFHGYIMNTISNFCLDILDQDEFLREVMYTGVYPCQKGFSRAQMFSLASVKYMFPLMYETEHIGQIRREWGCLTVVNNINQSVLFMDCNKTPTENQLWRYEKDSTIVNLLQKSCLDSTNLISRDAVVTRPCNSSNLYQKWLFQYREIYPD